MTIAYHRGRLIPILKQKYPELRGRMMAVGGRKEEFLPILEGLTEKEARIACYNSPSSLTISGDEPAIAELEKICEEKQVFNRRLVVDVAYHSHHMNLVAKEYRESIAYLRPPVPTDIRFHSSLHGHLIDGTELQPSYWVSNLTCPVRFSEALQSMLEPTGEHKHGVNMLVELGPHSALQGPIKQVLKDLGGNAPKIPYASALIRKRDAVETALELASNLFIRGADLDFNAINFPKPPTKPPILLTDLPRYPWNYSSKYWQESRLTQAHKHAAGERNDILGTLANYSNDLEPTWRNIVRLDDLPWLRQHKIQGLTVFPMAGYIAMAVEAATQRATSMNARFGRVELKNVDITKALVIPDKDLEMTITLRPHHEENSLVSSSSSLNGWDEFRICSWTLEQGWTEHCVGLVAALDAEGEDQNDVDGARQAREREARLESALLGKDKPEGASISIKEMYESLSELGVAYGPLFQGVNSCAASDLHAVGDIVVPDVAKEMPNGYLSDAVIQPAFLESLIEMYWPVVGAGRRAVSTVYLPSSVEKVSISLEVSQITRQPGSTIRAACQGEIAVGTPNPVKMNMAAVAGNGRLESLIALDGLTISPILDADAQEDLDAPRELCYKLEWEPILEADNAEESFPEDTEIVIIHEDSSFQSLVAMGLANALELATGRLPEVGALQTIDAAGKICVFLSELHQPFLSTLMPAQFDSLQKLLTTVQGVLWVVCGAYEKSADPNANMVTGLSRSIRSETALRFATLDLDADSMLSELDVAEAVMKVFRFVFGSSSSATGELEFMERGGAFFTPRIVHDAEMDEYVHKQTNPSVLEPTPFGEDGRALRMEGSAPGVLETLHFVDDSTVEQPLEADEVEIEVKAIGLNFRDGLFAKGQLPVSSCGIEASGVVTAAGDKAREFRVGDRVAALTQGAFAARTRTKAAFTFKIPWDVTFEAAATLPLAYATAYYSLIELGRLSEGETVLIHSAAGAVGQAAINIAQMIGAEVLVTVGSTEKKELLMGEFGLPEDHVFYSRNTSFGDGVRRAANGQGVDVILNSLTGNGLRESWKCLGKFGRFIGIGKQETGTKTRLELDNADSNASFVSIDMLALMSERQKIVKRVLRDVGQLLQYGKIRPISRITTFPISDVPGALTTFQAGKALGKIVVVPNATDVVQVCYH